MPELYKFCPSTFSAARLSLFLYPIHTIHRLLVLKNCQLINKSQKTQK